MIIRYIIAAVVAYILGSVSVAVLLTKLVMGVDVRKQGSGNAGATNVARNFGMKAGVLTLVGDMAKTAISGLIGMKLGGDIGFALACFFCLVGHCWPVFFQFKGGKGVAVAGCIALLYDWRILLIIAAVFFIVFFFSRRVSLCSCCAALCYPGSFYLVRGTIDHAFWMALVMAIMVIILHRKNIVRLIHGEEAEFRPKKTK